MFFKNLVKILFFKEIWLKDLNKKLENFLFETLKSSQNQPRLVELCAQQEDSESGPNVTKLKQQLIESEKRTMAFMRKFNKVQSDYHGLIGIDISFKFINYFFNLNICVNFRYYCRVS
jgi:hypothetical protein